MRTILLAVLLGGLIGCGGVPVFVAPVQTPPPSNTYQNTRDVYYTWQQPTGGCSQSCTYVVYVVIQTLTVPVPPCPDPAPGLYLSVNASNPTTELYYTYQGLPPGDEICAYVVAMNQNGSSGPSNVAQIALLPAPVIPNPVDP